MSRAGFKVKVQIKKLRVYMDGTGSDNLESGIA
jgi:hypothetical protein